MMNDLIRSEIRFPGHQAGIMTTFTGVLILVLLTLMMFFAIRVGVFEQRVSANDFRQKLAFHTAESGIQNAKEFFKANSVWLGSPTPGMLSDGTDGWMAPGNEHWKSCQEPPSEGLDPCVAEPDTTRRANMYYWWYPEDIENDPPTEDPSTNVPVSGVGLLADTSKAVEVKALLCLLHIEPGESPPVRGCSTNTDPEHSDDLDYVDGSRYMVILLAKGEADCVNSVNCGAESVITDQISNFGGTAGGQAPAVPLTTKNSFPPSGAAEVVANPNGGGVGVPISVWMNRNPACTPDGSAINPSQGSWGTCEANEWYETESIPEDVQCPGSCSCNARETISDTHGTIDKLGIDLVQDENFPCDLFQFYFGAPRTNYESVKSYAKVLSDCSTLGEDSAGIYWISGSTCTIGSNATIGSVHAPVLLISAATTTRLQGGTITFGAMYVTDVENSAATFEVQGNNIVYGQVVVDAAYGNNYNGTFQVVYNENLIQRVSGTGGIGNVIGGWADFHEADWQAWQ